MLLTACGRTEITEAGSAETSVPSLYPSEITGSSVIQITPEAGTTSSPVSESPRLILAGEKEMILDYEAPYVEPGFQAVNGRGEDISGRVICESEVGPLPDSLLITYRLPEGEQEITETRLILREDLTPPELLLLGEDDLYLKDFSDFREPGFMAWDSHDGSLTNQVSYREYFPKDPDFKVLIYQVRDKAGHHTEARRQLHLLGPSTEPAAETSAQPPAEPTTEAASIPAPTEPLATAPPTVPAPTTAPPLPSGERLVYLTFDDGPFMYTERLLDILASYNVKASFFVTAAYPEYYHLINREAAEGHTVALHTASHQYAQIYSSEWAYFEDLAKIEEIVTRQTGIKPWLLRFPGGSSNTVSADYNPGIMSRLTKQVEEKGYRYIDWNVSSGDGASQSREAVFQNVIRGISGKEISVVLMHDIKSETVEAVPSIIEWCLSNGYQLLPITPSTPDCHHSVNN